MNSTDMITRRPYQRASQESRREDLIKAALKLIGEGWPQAATVRAIADEAGVTAGLIRHYFQTKEELVRNAYQYLMAKMNDDSTPPGPQDMPDPKHRLARFIVTSITPPMAQPDTVGQWAGFLHMMRADQDMRAAHRQSYVTYRNVLQDLILAVLPQLTPVALRRAAIACTGTLDGLWLEASLISDSFEHEEIAEIGLSAVGAILGVELTKA